MPRNTSVTLGDHFSAFVERQVSEGRYGTASEVVRAGLRLLENHEAKLKALRQALHEGIDSGVAEDFDFDEWLTSPSFAHPVFQRAFAISHIDSASKLAGQPRPHE